MDTAAWYRWFAENEACGSSPRYERLAEAVAESDELLDWLALLPGAKRQANLLFASVRFIGGSTDTVDGFRSFVRTNGNALAATMRARSTQTNEAARCAAFVPLLAELDAEVALIEVGASAGLCLFPDRYSYLYDGRRVGDSEVAIAVETGGSFPVPRSLPTVSWRAGLDLNPLNVCDDEDLAWLQACIWPEHEERRERFDLAAAIVADDPPRIDRGDLRTSTLDLIDAAPSGAVKVVVHSAVLAYVDEASRRDFTATMRTLVNGRHDVIWLSNESLGIIDGLAGPEATAPQSSFDGAHFHLGRNGAELVALTDPHGAWIEWLASTSPR